MELFLRRCRRILQKAHAKHMGKHSFNDRASGKVARDNPFFRDPRPVTNVRDQLYSDLVGLDPEEELKFMGGTKVYLFPSPIPMDILVPQGDDPSIVFWHRSQPESCHR